MSDVIESAPVMEGAAVGLSYLERARLLAPLIESEADEIERQGHLTERVVKAFSDQGMFWLLVPAEWGGGGISLEETLEVLEEVAAADGSSGWCLMVNNLGAAMSAGYLPLKGGSDLYAGPEKAISAGADAPTATGRIVDGGLMVTGRWAFGSTTHYATSIGGGMQVVDDEGNPVFLEDGRPDLRVGYFTRDQMVFHDNWDVTGLKGTGSQDFSVTDQFVSDDHWFSPFGSGPVRTEACYALPPILLATVGHAGVALGLAKRALQEVATTVQGKKRTGYPVTVDQYPVFVYEFVKAEADYQTARAYLLQTVAAIETYAAREGEVTDEMTARAQQAATWTHDMSQRVVSFAHLWSGTQAVKKSSKLARVTADAGVIKQHLRVDQITYVPAGAEILKVWVRK